MQPGDVATLRSRRGKVSLQLRRDDGMPAGAVCVPFAYDEAVANLPSNDALDPVGKIPEFKYCARCRCWMTARPGRPQATAAGRLVLRLPPDGQACPLIRGIDASPPGDVLRRSSAAPAPQ